MIEEARKSLEEFLKLNIHLIEPLSIIGVKNIWLGQRPEYKKYDINLDVVWEGLSGKSEWDEGYTFGCLDGCCPRSPAPRAKSTKVVIKDWQEENYINNRINFTYDKFLKMQQSLKSTKAQVKL